MNPLLEKLRAEKKQGTVKSPVSSPVYHKKYVTEAHRIADIPVQSEQSEDLTSQLKTRTGTSSLRPIQSRALSAIRDNLGGFFPIGVGHGKSLIALLAGTVLDSRCSIILVPASTVGTMEKTLKDFSNQFRMPENIHILSYSKLSRPEGTAILDKLRAGIPAKDVVIVCDEVHRIKRKEASRTKRIVRWFRQNEDARFVGLSGTITSKSIKDFSHVVALSLRHGSPLPLNQGELGLWAITLDVPNWGTDKDKDRLRRKGVNFNQKSLDALLPIKEWANNQGLVSTDAPETVVGKGSWLDCYTKPGSQNQDTTREEKVTFMRKAFGLRLRTSPGVVATEETSIGTSLYIREMSPDAPEEITEAIRTAIEYEGFPRGENFDSDIAKWRCLRQLSWGYYLVWDWGDRGPDTDWLITRAAWRRVLYQELQYRSDQGYDSPLLVTRKVQRDIATNQKLTQLHHLWMDWDGQRHKPTPPTVATWIHEGLIAETLHDISSRKEAQAIWCDSKEMQDMAKRLGYTVYGSGATIPDHPHTAVLSMAAHGIGKNLVQWSNANVLTWQSDGQAVEQLLGRHHRPGQDADEVYFNVYTHTPVFKKALRDSRTKAKYIENVTGNKQKLLLATTV